MNKRRSCLRSCGGKGVVFAVHHLCGFADPAPIERAYAAAGLRHK